ncbi:hypothetical protein IEQ34_003955 [Dendrobium chrysotoxum]|uniref:DUF6821 domain-containing protein n=1 Tax=Dendrobium chrysotoxum TaxID=161865 RepID=A0AAV7HEJ1_DENCH|nr:hypothetical protein IEQ34_003955 [Dendrobium chrysotoxum]
MKRKSRTIPLKLAIDDKKVSQFTAHSTSLNEAFSMVRRMPIIRPSLQAGVATQRAALPLR